MREKQKNIVKRLRSKYRLVILNDETFEEKVSLKLSRLNVFLVVTIAAIILVGSTIFLIAFTPLREYIPGYASTELRRNAVELSIKADSLEQQLAFNQSYYENIRNIINGNPIDPAGHSGSDSATVNGELNPPPSEAISSLRQIVEEEERFNINNTVDENLVNFSFMAPVKGLLSSLFDKNAKHFGVDVTAKKNTPIKACLAGNVVFAEWTAESGYVLIIQHTKELISVYKHCSALLKRVGDNVQTGEAVAIIGNSGENSTGPHLHFELWHRGTPVNPQDYISF
jgi:murein DD-endopeptidase MepM/ murein hydrolase activator NlpD